MAGELKGGWMGHYLEVDLTTGDITVSETDMEMVKKYIGGAGIGLKVAYDEFKPGVDAFDPSTPIVLATGPITGTRAPSSGGFTFVSKSPITNTFAMGNANGFFGQRMKASGFDYIVIRGKSEKPVYLWVHDGEAELRDASEFWTEAVGATQERVKEEIGDDKASVLCIGTAGANLVKYASTTCDFYHVASSGGTGAVMGSKNLKAVAAQGSQKTPVVDEEAEKAAAKAWIGAITDTFFANFAKPEGTTVFFTPLSEMGDVPTKNLTTNEFEYESMLGISTRPQMKTSAVGCWRCPIGHCHRVEFTEGIHKGVICDEPEYEGLVTTGTNIGNTDLASAVYLMSLVDEYGMDLKTLSYVLSLLMECYEEGLISKEELGGLEFNWGNVDSVEVLLGMIARREGPGEWLGENLISIADHIGGDAADRAVHIKGGGLNLHDVRTIYGFALGMAVSPFATTYISTGGDYGNDPELAPPLDMHKVDGQGNGVKITSRKSLLSDCLMACMFCFSTALVPTSFPIDSLNAVTGAGYTRDELFEAMDRLQTLARVVNVRNGLTPAQDTVSERLMQPQINGPAKGTCLRDAIPVMVKDYYNVMGWDVETGVPLPETLKELGLEFAIEEMWGKQSEE